MSIGRTSEDVAELLKEIQGQRTLTKFAEDLRVSKAYLSMVMSGGKPPSEKLLKRAYPHKYCTKALFSTMHFWY